MNKLCYNCTHCKSKQMYDQQWGLNIGVAYCELGLATYDTNNMKDFKCKGYDEKIKEHKFKEVSE